MPKKIHGEEFYQTNEVCHIAGISKATFFRWVSEGLVADVTFRDRRGWRLFSEAELECLINEANRTYNTKRNE